MYHYKMKPRDKGYCPSCGKIVAILKGVGPFNEGRGNAIFHKGKYAYHCFVGSDFVCKGGQVIKKLEASHEE